MNWRDPQHSLAGGAELYAWEFARALVSAGARVDFVTAREPKQERRQTLDGIAVVRGGNQLSFYVHALVWLLLRRHRLDAVVDADCGIPVFSPLVLSRRRTAIILLVHHVHLDQFATYFPPAVAWLGRFLEGWAMPRLYQGLTTVAVSDSTRREMVERLGWREHVQVLHNGNAAEVVREDSLHDAARDVDRVVVLGRLAPHKRVDEVLRAIVELRRSRRALHLDVIGKGPESVRLAEMVRNYELDEAVTLHGFLDEDAKRRRLTMSMLHISASDVEGWGQVVIETASYGIPTLARDVPGMRDSIHDGVTGWLLDERATGGAPLATRLARGIDLALKELADDHRRREIAIACRQWAVGFSWEAMHAGAEQVVVRALEEAR